MDQETTFRRLRIYNLVMGIFHAAQGILMVWLSNDFTLPIRTNYLLFDTATRKLVTDTQTAFNLKFGIAVACFLFLSALAHLLLTLPGIYPWYIKNLKKGINKARWIEYAFSSSLMIILIAMLTGIYDLVALIAIFAVNASMNLFGYMMELHNQTTERTDWTSFTFGCLAGIVPWGILVLQMVGSASGNNADIPGFVYAILITIFATFNIFPVNMVLQYKKVGPWKNYVFGEAVYILLSLLAKSALAWQIFAGTLQPV